MLIKNEAYSEIKNEAPNIKLIIPSTTTGLTNEELDEIEDILKTSLN